MFKKTDSWKHLSKSTDSMKIILFLGCQEGEWPIGGKERRPFDRRRWGSQDRGHLCLQGDPQRTPPLLCLWQDHVEWHGKIAFFRTVGRCYSIILLRSVRLFFQSFERHINGALHKKMMDLLSTEHEQMANFLRNHSNFMESRHDLMLNRKGNKQGGRGSGGGR